MGFLESAGRSGGIGQLGQGFLSGAIQAGQFTQQAETNEMQQQLLQMKTKEQERLDRPMLLSELVSKGSEKGKPNVMKLFADAAKIAGGKKIMLPGGGEDYTVTPADLPNIQKFMETQKDLHPQIMWAQYQDNQQAIPELQKQLEKAKTPVEQMQITEQIEKLKIESAGILKEFGKEEKGYTLGPGQTRFSEQNKLVAEGGAKEPTAIDDDRKYREIAIKGESATPEETSWAKAYEKQKTLTTVESGKVRAEIWKEIAGDIRQTPVYDKEQGTITFATANEIKANPNRFAPPGAQQKVQGQQALIQDIKGQIGRTTTALTNMRSEFSPDQRAKIILVLRHRDPAGAWSNFMGSNWASTLSEDQQDYVVSLLQLKEQAMAMRAVLGAGQGSDMMREAIDKTLPGMITPDRKFAHKQLAEFGQTLYRLEQYVPKASVTPGVTPPVESSTEVNVERGPDGKLIIRR